MQKSKKTAVLQPQYEQVGQLWRSYGCCLPTQPKLPLKCRVLVLSPQTTLPELPGPQKPRKTSRPSSRDPKNAPGIAKASRLIFQNWKARGHIKWILNKLGCKRETSERCSNSLESESLCSSTSQETALQSLLIFSIRWALQKSQLGCVEIFRIPGLVQKIAFMP